jgi:hypothetical protein
MTEGYYSQMDMQVDKYRKKGQTNHVDDIKVLNAELLGWKQEGSTNIITARIMARIIDYVTDDNTGSLVRGNKHDQKLMTYEWQLVKNAPDRSADIPKICPHCGAKLDINRSGVCEFCGSEVTSDSFDWAVRNIKGISQKTL